MTTSLNSAQVPRNPHNEFPATNTGSATISAGDVVMFDTANPPTVLAQTAWAVKQCTGAGAIACGVAVDGAVQNAQLRVQYFGLIQVVASGAIAMNAAVVPDTAGQVKTTPGGVPQIGIAASPASASGDTLAILLVLANNA